MRDAPDDHEVQEDSGPMLGETQSLEIGRGELPPQRDFSTKCPLWQVDSDG